MREGQALARRARGQQHRGGRGGLPEADGGDVGLDELHRVVDGEQRRDVAAGAVDVDVDVLVGVLGLEVQQLGADQVGDRVVDRRAEEDDVLLEQAGVEVVGPLAPVGLLDDRRGRGSCGPVPSPLLLFVLVGCYVRPRPRHRAPRSPGPRGRPGRSAFPSSSTISTCSTSQSRALRLRMSERTAGIWSPSSRASAHLGGGLVDPLGQLLELLVEVLVGGLDALGLGDRPEREVDLGGHDGGVPQLVDELTPGPGRVAARYCSRSMPWAWRRMARSWRRCCISAGDHAPRALVASTSSPASWAAPLRRPIWAMTTRVMADRLREVVAQLGEGLELGGLGGPLVVELGEHLLLDLLDQDPQAQRGLAVRVGVLGVELEDVAGLGAPELVVELGHDGPGADLVEVVVGGEAGRPARRPPSPRCRW